MDVPVYHLEKVVKAKQQDLEDFDGPLDLILALLSKDKIEIRDIVISDLLDQYTAWMDRREALNLEVASEFVTMAAQLLYIKTRMLLSIEDEAGVSEMEELMAALEERKNQDTYLKIKEVSGSLADRYAFGRDYMAKAPEAVEQDKTYQYVHAGQDLMKALRSVLLKVGAKAQPTIRAFQNIVGREPYPVADKARAILDRLVQFGVARFKALFRTSRSRSEVVATFLAILELSKAGRVHLAGTAEDCTVTATANTAGDDLNVTVESY